MKKRVISVFLAAVMLLLCGCNHLAMEKNLPGTWRSEDGCTVTFADSVITVRDADGNVLEGFPAAYFVSGNTLYLASDDTLTEMFECRIDGDELTLIYTDAFLLQTVGSAKKNISISLVRCD